MNTKYYVRYKYDHDSSISGTAIDLYATENNTAQQILDRINEILVKGQVRDKVFSIESINKL